MSASEPGSRPMNALKRIWGVGSVSSREDGFQVFPSGIGVEHACLAKPCEHVGLQHL